ADRLDEAVDERRLEVGSGRRRDAPAEDDTSLLRAVECVLPARARSRSFDGGERPRDAPAHVLDAAFVALGVLLEQHLGRDRLRGEGVARLELPGVVALHRVLAGGITLFSSIRAA